MACSVCNHTMQNPGQKDIFYCPRCGTLKIRDIDRDITIIPKLVEEVKNITNGISVELLINKYTIHNKSWQNIKECVGQK